jgi:hypothetical protein
MNGAETTATMSLFTLLLIFLTISGIWTFLRIGNKRMGWVDEHIAYESSAIKAILCWLVVAEVWLPIRKLF